MRDSGFPLEGGQEAHLQWENCYFADAALGYFYHATSLDYVWLDKSQILVVKKIASINFSFTEVFL